MGASRCWRAPAKPGIAKCSPLREEESRHFSEFFRAWWKSHGFSERELAAMLRVSKSVARKKLEGHAPVQLHEVRLMPTVVRQAFSIAYLAWLDQSPESIDGIPSQVVASHV